MKKILLLVAIAVSNLANASDLLRVKLDKNEKLQSTFSASIGNRNSVHFTLVKNTNSKKFLLTPYLIDNTKAIKKLSQFVSENEFNIISFHSNNEILSIVDYNSDDKQINFIDFNLSTGASTSTTKQQKTPFDHLFRLKDKTLLVTLDKKQNFLKVQSIGSSDNIKDINIAIPEDKQKLFKKLAEQTPESVNQDEFVKNGSISPRKAYAVGDGIIYTFEKDKSETQVLKFDLTKSSDFNLTSISTEEFKSSKDVSNYLINDNIAFLAVDKEDVKVNLFDINSAKKVNSLSLKSDLSNLVNQESLSSYIKAASKSSNKSTLTVNRTDNNKLRFRLDYVNSANYNYNYNWWYHQWFFQQMMMQQQQMMLIHRQLPTRMGPANEDNELAYFEEWKEEEKKAIEFTLDIDFKVTGQDDKLIYPEIDKDKYLEKYKNNRTVKQFTSNFENNEMRIIYQDLNSKDIVIGYENL